MEHRLKYRDLDFFKEEGVYLFKGIVPFISKVEISRGRLYTTSTSTIQHVATTVRAADINDEYDIYLYYIACLAYNRIVNGATVNYLSLDELKANCKLWLQWTYKYHKEEIKVI